MVVTWTDEQFEQSAEFSEWYLFPETRYLNSEFKPTGKAMVCVRDVTAGDFIIKILDNLDEAMEFYKKYKGKEYK